MFTLLSIVFVLGYIGIALEHPLKIDKAAIALFMAVVCWTLVILSVQIFFPELSVDEGIHHTQHALMEHLSEISGILFFLIGAMTIVEIIDAHEGFSIITDRIATTNKVRLLWVLCLLTFFLSAALDNLTTSIVMVALLKKLIKDKEDLWLFAGMVILAANAGGAWSPIGDVTTIMLWIDGQVTAINIVAKLLLPSLVCLVVPLIVLSFRLKGEVTRPVSTHHAEHYTDPVEEHEKKQVFTLGIGALLFVPIFKTVTHLPPFMGILLGLSILWIFTEIIHRSKKSEQKTPLSIVGVLRKIDTPSILFFLGILTAVASLQTTGHLALLSRWLDDTLGNIYVLNAAVGALSAVVDNVPLVAGAIGMYGLETYPTDHLFWELLAYCAGTGGSLLIIGSAAGVAVMGILKIDFIWYLRKISFYALIGYLSGLATVIVLNSI